MESLVSVVMGSISDLKTMKHSITVLKQFNIKHEVKIVSAHRSPVYMKEYAEGLVSRGVSIVIAGAGGAAHLPGMIASYTSLPVIGVPIRSSLNGMDSLYSILQMPKGIPVATFAIGDTGAVNAALFAVSTLGYLQDKKTVIKNIEDYRKRLANSINEMQDECDNEIL